MATTTRRASQHVTLLIVVLASITALTLNYRGQASHGISRVRSGVADALAPVQRAIARIIHPLGDVVSGALHYGTVQRENAALRQQLAQLANGGAESTYLSERASQVFQLAHLPDSAGVPTLVAPVLLGPSSNFEQTIELGVGTDEGVGPGMPVEEAGGLVGSVLSAGASTSRVLLLTDPRSSVAVRFGVTGTGSVAVLQGQGAGKPLAVTSASGLVVHRGEQVLTSGLAAASYPAGLPVGRVATVSLTAGGLSESVTVTPAATAASAQYVAVLLWTPSA